MSANYSFNQRVWGDEQTSDIIILAIHGYNDYSNSFEKPADVFSKFNIQTISFDLRGFGKNYDAGHWFPLQVHTEDVFYFVKKLKKENFSIRRKYGWSNCVKFD